MYPEGEYCTATMEPGTLYVLMTGIQQEMRPKPSVICILWATMTIVKVLRSISCT